MHVVERAPKSTISNNNNNINIMNPWSQIIDIYKYIHTNVVCGMYVRVWYYGNAGVCYIRMFRLMSRSYTSQLIVTISHWHV